MELNSETFAVDDATQMEALAWLRQVGEEMAGQAVHTIGGLDHAKSVAVVEELYQLGAEQVRVVGIRKEGGMEKSDAVAIKLPEDPGIRLELFDWAASQVESRGGEGEADRGQGYLVSRWES